MITKYRVTINMLGTKVYKHFRFRKDANKWVNEYNNMHLFTSATVKKIRFKDTAI